MASLIFWPRWREHWKRHETRTVDREFEAQCGYVGMFRERLDPKHADLKEANGGLELDPNDPEALANKRACGV